MKYLLLFTMLFIGCADNSEKVITIERKDLIPEGIAIGPEGEIYLSCLHTKNIIRTNADGSDPQVIETEYTGRFSGVGITVVDNKIFALGNNEEGGYNSVLQIIDKESGELIAGYELSDTIRSFYNDLAVSDVGEVFVTNSDKHAIHTLSHFTLSNFLVSEEIEYPNGIAISDDNSKLYIASFRKGIRILDLETKEFLNEADSTGLTWGIDGMKFYENSLIGIQNASRNREKHSIVRFYLNERGTEIIKADTLIANHSTFNIPTTLDIKDAWVYCLANSQLENLNQETMELIRPEELTNTYILKFRLK
ncbi:MAG: hypothetical protein RIM99_01210 [Cyclobacteriaceae bacterium]